MRLTHLPSTLEQLRHSPLVQRFAQTRPGRALGDIYRSLRGEHPAPPTEAPSDAPRDALREELAKARQDLEATERYLKMHRDPNQWPSFSAMSEVIDDTLRPPLDRLVVDEARLTPRQKFWRENGYLILENFLPHDLIDAYVAVRQKWQSPLGWGCPTPYMHVPEIRDLGLYRPLLDVMEELFGGEMLMHLNLTGWVSTERDWHQDDYLNPPVINGWYLAAWMALEDIHPDSGPFQWVPGSHRWPTLRQEKVRSFLPPLYERAEGRQHDFGHWASWSEDYVARAVAKQIEDTALVPQEFLAKKGDVLLWHACVAHRGSRPRVAGTPRKALIAHYSEIAHRVDFPAEGRRAHRDGGKYQDFGIPLY